ncbi:hypothetical protein BASA83_007321 [Batrachochytrium salamandrivorans]|nr:hypothetical protein BASA83_007321 [Batrachochytrium salamandrivorans]
MLNFGILLGARLDAAGILTISHVSSTVDSLGYIPTQLLNSPIYALFKDPIAFSKAVDFISMPLGMDQEPFCMSSAVLDSSGTYRDVDMSIYWVDLARCATDASHADNTSGRHTSDSSAGPVPNDSSDHKSHSSTSTRSTASMRLLVSIDVVDTRPPVLRPPPDTFTMLVPDHPPITLPTIYSGFISDSGLLMNVLTRIEQYLYSLPNLEQRLSFMARVVRRMINFDQVSIYKLGNEKDMSIIFEEENEMTSTNFNYPGFKGAKFVVSESRWKEGISRACIRMVEDIQAPNAYIYASDPTEILTLECCTLKPLFAFQTKYISEIGARAVFYIRLCVFGESWASISLHCGTPNRPSLSCMSFFGLLSHAFSRAIEDSLMDQTINAGRILADQTFSNLGKTIPQTKDHIKQSSSQNSCANQLASLISNLLPMFTVDSAIVCLRNDVKFLNTHTDPNELQNIAAYLRRKQFKDIFISRCCARDYLDATHIVNGKTVRIFVKVAGIMLIPLSASGDAFLAFIRHQNPEFARNVRYDLDDLTKKGNEIPDITSPEQIPCDIWTKAEENLGKVLQIVFWTFIASLQERETGLNNEQLKDIMLANVSHEVRTPLNGIINFLEVMMEDMDSESFMSCWNYAYDASRSVIHIINELLLITKTKWGDIYLRIVIGDQEKIRQVLTNLLGNAVKYTEKGFVKLVVVSKIKPDKTLKISLSIHDSGMGIPSDKLNTIFQAFERIDDFDDRRRDIEGVGLGLAICSKLTALMNGSLTVDSTEQNGAIFTFKLCLPIQSQRTCTESYPGDSKPLVSAIQRPLSVFIADDDLISQQVMKMRLVRDGHSINVFNNGQLLVDKIHELAKAVALEASNKNVDESALLSSPNDIGSEVPNLVQELQLVGVDLILMDMHMPHMGGLEASKRIRQIEHSYNLKRTPIIATTGAAETENRIKCLSVGMDGFTSKPVDFTILRVMIQLIQDGTWDQRDPKTGDQCPFASRENPNLFMDDRDNSTLKWINATGWFPQSAVEYVKGSVLLTEAADVDCEATLHKPFEFAQDF